MSTPPDIEAQATARRARADLEDIDRLKNYAPFAEYFLRRVAGKIATRERAILSTATSPEETTAQKRIVEALRADVLKLLDDDEAACRSILAEDGCGSER